MAKEELLELDNEHEVLAYTAGKMRKFRIRTGVGDRVIVEMSPYDLQRGRISFRHKGDAPAASPQQRRPTVRGRREANNTSENSGALQELRAPMPLSFLHRLVLAIVL